MPNKSYTRFQIKVRITCPDFLKAVQNVKCKVQNEQNHHSVIILNFAFLTLHCR